jgi:hypothetical protein
MQQQHMEQQYMEHQQCVIFTIFILVNLTLHHQLASCMCPIPPVCLELHAPMTTQMQTLVETLHLKMQSP